MMTVHINNLTNQQAMEWLLINDPEGSHIWEKATSGLVEAVQENLRDFGHDNQDGEIFVEVPPLFRVIRITNNLDGLEF